MIVCSRCGASNQPTSKFCLSCGNPLAAAAAPPPAYGAPPPAPAPQVAPAPAPAWGPPVQPAPAAPPQYGGPPAAPPWQPAPPAAAPGYGPPAQPWSPPAPQAGFTPAAPVDRARFGAPEGMNPFGATVGPDFVAGASPHAGYAAPPAPAGSQGPYGPPPAAYAPPAPPAAYAPPPAAAYAPPPAAAYPPPPAGAYAPPPAGAYAPPPAAAYGAPPAIAYAPPPAANPWAPPTPAPPQQPSAPSGQSGAHSHDPSAFAATSPPPTTDEHEAQIRRSQSPLAPHHPSAPPVSPSAAPPAAALGPGRDPELVEAGAIRTLAGFLVSYDASELGVFWPIYQGQNVLGRKGAGAGLDIEVDSPTTSSRHAIVYASARPGRLKLEDSGSTNGTFLNDAPLERGKKYELRDNDTLRFGGFNVTVKVI